MLPWKNFAIEAPRAKRWFLRNADQPVGTLLCLLAGIAACAALDRHAWKIFAISFVLVYFAKRREVALLIGAILVSRVYPFFPIESFASGLGIERGNAYWPFIASFAVKFSTTALVVWYVIASERIANRFAHLRWIAPLALAVGALLAFSPLAFLEPIGNFWQLTFLQRCAVAMSFVACGLLPYVAYDLIATPPEAKARGWWRIGLYRPFWMVNFIAPIPGGQANLKELQANDSARLAEVRASGLGLIALGLLFSVAYQIWYQVILNWPQGMFYGWLPSFQVMPLKRALADVASGRLFGFLEAWEILFAEFFRFLLWLSAKGHLIVGILRLLGYAAPRNTDRPVGSTSFIEFFGRYNYYFKELLLNVFYYPLYFGPLRALAAWPRLRMTLAVLASVGVGNFLVHLALHVKSLYTFGFKVGVIRMAPYALYCAILAIVIALSQIRAFESRVRPKGWNRLMAQIGVIVFYAWIRACDNIFEGDILNNIAFMASALGLEVRR